MQQGGPPLILLAAGGTGGHLFRPRRCPKCWYTAAS